MGRTAACAAMLIRVAPLSALFRQKPRSRIRLLPHPLWLDCRGEIQRRYRLPSLHAGRVAHSATAR